MDIEEYQASLLTELGAPSYDDLLSKIDEAVEKLKRIPGIVEIVDRIAQKLGMEADLAYLILFSIELWSHTLALLKNGENLMPFEEYLQTL